MYPYDNINAESLANSTFALKEGDDTIVVVTTTNSNGDIAITNRSKVELLLSIQTRDAQDAAAITALQANRTKYATALATINSL